LRALRPAFLATGIATGAAAQTLGVSPIPQGAEERFCYYAGLAYSPDAIVSLDIPLARQGQLLTQKGVLLCTRDPETGLLSWAVVDTDPQSTGWN